MSDDIQRSLGRIEGKLDAMLSKQEATDERLTNHGGRLAKMERWQARVHGGYAALAAVAAISWKFFKE